MKDYRRGPGRRRLGACQSFAGAVSDRGSPPGKVLRARWSCEEADGVAEDIDHAIDLAGRVVKIKAGAGRARQAEAAHERLVTMVAAAKSQPALVGEGRQV